MQVEAIKALIEDNLENTSCDVTGDGYHFNAVVVSPLFEGLNSVKKQQLVYAVLQPHITSGEIHAISLKTYTPSEWQAKN